MNIPHAVAIALTAIFLLSLAVLRLLFGASQVAAASALCRLPGLPKGWRRWLLGERHGQRASER